MTPDEMKGRTRLFALQVIRFAERLPRSRTGDVLARQMIRCGSSVGANYRAACRARSPAEFVAKLGIVEEEADETIYWLEMSVDARLATRDEVADLLDEAHQILSMTVASIRTARRSSSEKGVP